MYFKNVELFSYVNNIKNLNSFYAHIQDTKNDETLLEHTDKVLLYVDNIIKTKKLTNVLSTIENSLLGVNCKDIVRKVYKELMLNAIYLHDIGKINKVFQSDKLKNSNYIDAEGGNSNHSPLSSALYFDIYYSKLYNLMEEGVLDEVDFKLLCYILIVNSYVVYKHHSSLDYLGDYVIDTFICNLEKLQNDSGYKDSLNAYMGTLFVDIEQDKSVIDEVVKYAYNLKKSKNKEIDYFIYSRLLYSILVSADFYATYDYMQDVGVDVEEGSSYSAMLEGFRDGEVYKTIAKHKEYISGTSDTKVYDDTDINKLRAEMFIESENTLLTNSGKDLFFLEAPTGSGKTIASINLALNLLNNSDGSLTKWVYGFPFNTLVEQTKCSIEKELSGVPNLSEQMCVLNSVTKIKDICRDGVLDYDKSVMYSSFLKYPLVLTSSVKIIDILLSTGKSKMYPLYNLCNSVIVLDEIQVYKNSIWKEMMLFLDKYASLLNIKFIIMSATLPGLDRFCDSSDLRCVNLITNRSKYYNNPLFKNRVSLDFSLLSKGEFELDAELFKCVGEALEKFNKVLVCFITQESCKQFYLKSKSTLKGVVVYFLNGDVNKAERKRIIDEITNSTNKVLLVATQVIEAGIDIDMDVGFKDISILDSEEQFLGRINRNCKKDGSVAYFFNRDNAKKVYKQDYRLSSELTLLNKDMQNILITRDFNNFYERVLGIIDENKGVKASASVSIPKFIDTSVNLLNYEEIASRLKLITNAKNVSVFLNRDIEGENIDGKALWKEFKKVVMDRGSGVC